MAADAIPSLSWIDFQGYVSFMKRTNKEIDLILEKWLEEHLRKRGEEKDGKCESDFMDVMISAFQEEEEICGYKREMVIKATSVVRFLGMLISSNYLAIIILIPSILFHFLVLLSNYLSNLSIPFSFFFSSYFSRSSTKIHYKISHT